MPISRRAEGFTESVIREMSRLCAAAGGVNLAQGFPDFPAPQAIKDAACQAIQDDINQYAITWGSKRLRDAIATKMQQSYGLEVDPEREITVTCGATEAMIAALMALVNPGDEVIIFEPFYENYGPDAILSGATPRMVTLHEPHWSIDDTELRQAFGPKTRAIVLNSPHNPTGKVFSEAELRLIADLCQEFDTVCITDEIYEYMVYEGRHIPMATLPGMRERTVTISGLSKTFSVTGWRLGYAVAPPALTNAIRKVHDFLTVGAPAPLQEAAAVALGFGDGFYRELADGYRLRRQFLVEALQKAGFGVWVPQGAYYVMTDISAFGFADDAAFSRHLIEKIGVAGVPGSSFYLDPKKGSQRLRFNFAKRQETLDEAALRLQKLQAAAQA